MLAKLPETLLKELVNMSMTKKNNKDTANSQHYNSKGHSLSDFRAMVIEKVIPNDVAWLLEREEMWIRRLETKNLMDLIELTEIFLFQCKLYLITEPRIFKYILNYLLYSTLFKNRKRLPTLNNFFSMNNDPQITPHTPQIH